MPRGDRTGPTGLGPMTGKQAGYCNGNPVPGYMNPAGGAGYGRGGGRGMGRGRGYRNRANAGRWQYGDGWGRFNPQFPPVPSKESEVEMLKAQSDYLEQQLSGIRKRLQELETGESKQ